MDWLQLHNAILQITNKPIYMAHPHIIRELKGGGHIRRSKANWWINVFKDLMECEVFTPGNDLEMECLWFCFSNLIQQDLDHVKDHWNTHYIRRSRYDTVPGRPMNYFICLKCTMHKISYKLSMRNNAKKFWNVMHTTRKMKTNIKITSTM